jgi:hypothetical protein
VPLFQGIGKALVGITEVMTDNTQQEKERIDLAKKTIMRFRVQCIARYTYTINDAFEKP